MTDFSSRAELLKSGEDRFAVRPGVQQEALVGSGKLFSSTPRRDLLRAFRSHVQLRPVFFKGGNESRASTSGRTSAELHGDVLGEDFSGRFTGQAKKTGLASETRGCSLSGCWDPFFIRREGCSDGEDACRWGWEALLLLPRGVAAFTLHCNATSCSPPASS